jgi:site-specific DNA recombinase
MTAPVSCVLYARVSTDRQAEKDLSLPAQLEAMREHARRLGWTVAEEVLEPGASAKTADRPALQQLLSRIRSGELTVGAVLVHKLDRFARNVYDHATIKALLLKHGVRLASVVENIDDTVSGELVEHIMAAIAQFYSGNLSQETKKGMRQKVLAGGWPHKPPRGYVTVRQDGRSRIEIHPRIGPLVRQAFELYATGLYSIEMVADRLRADGLVTASGNRLSKAHLHRILTNHFYVGRVRWQGLDVEAKHPSLVTPQLFAKVQDAIAKRFKAVKSRSAVAGLPLRRLAICARCRGRMTGEWHGRWAYYRCSRRSYRRDLCDSRMCSAKMVHEDLKRVCCQVQITRARAQQIKRAAEAIVAKRTGSHMRSRMEQEGINLQREESQLARAFVAGDVEAARYREQAEDIRRRRESLDDRSAEASGNSRQVLAAVAHRLEIATALWDLYANFDERRGVDLLRTVFKSLVMDARGLTGYVLNPPFDGLVTDALSPDNAARALLDAPT